MTYRFSHAPTSVLTLPAGDLEYRYEPGARDPVLVFHGAQLHAGIRACEQVFHERGHGVIVATRPGYGRTTLPRLSAAEFADVTAALCAQLGISRLASVLCFSAGGLYGAEFATRYRNLAGSMIFLSATPSTRRWPDVLHQRALVPVIFSPLLQKPVWGIIHGALRVKREMGLWLTSSHLTLTSGRACVADMLPADRAEAAELLLAMQSRTGFRNDLGNVRGMPMERMTTLLADIGCPTLVLGTPHDGTVLFDHAQRLVDAIPGARLYTSSALWHLIWLGRDRVGVMGAIRDFLEDVTKA